MDLDEKSLEVLSCNLVIRPRNAAGIQEILPFVSKVELDENKVIVDFDAAGKASIESFVSAERLCCTGITWDLRCIGNELRLHVSGTSQQVTIIKQWFEDPA
jgi:hypothetical protein